MEKIEIIISESGTLTERNVIERELDAGNAVLEALTSDVTRTIRNALAVPGWGVAHANVGVVDTIWSVAIDHLNLDARFRLINQVLVPMFASNTDEQLPLVWSCPPEIRLLFVTQTAPDAPSTVAVIMNWLIAYHMDGNGYRLPLPNIHDDCHVCMGEFKTCYPTAGGAVIASLEQFRKSEWNSDLMRTTEQSQRFFRFKPSNEGFATLAIDAPDWTTLCNKVSVPIMERIIL